MSKSEPSAGDVGSYSSFQFASGRMIEGGVALVTEDGFAQLEDGRLVNFAHVESVSSAERPAEPETEEEESSE